MPMKIVSYLAGVFMIGKYRVNDVAGILQVSQTTIYKRFAGMKDRLKPHAHKEKGVLFFDDTALEIFRESIVTADQEAIQVSPSKDVGNLIQDEINELKTVLLTMVDTMRCMVEENRFFRGEVTNLKNQITGLQVSLLSQLPPPAQETTPCVPWSPKVQPDPTANMTWWYQLWLEITAPEKLRRFA